MKWQEYLFEATASAGKPIQYDRKIGEYLKEAGFINVQEHVIQLPLNPWPQDPHLKDLSRWYQLGLSEGIEGMTLGPMCRVMKWPLSSVHQFLKDVMREIRSRKIHGYHEAYVQKLSISGQHRLTR